MSIDLSKAPEGATHWHKDSEVWCMVVGKTVFYWKRGCWIKSFIIFTEDDYIARPTAPTWNGEGLPPVGTVCELQDATEVRILAHTKRAGAPVAVYQCTDSESIEAYTASFFRPIRTPEQIAAEERDNAIKEMAEELGIMHTTAAQAYDKGYRKIES